MEVDVILLSYTKNDDIFNMTKKSIESIISSEANTKFNIYLIETENTGKYVYNYSEVKTIVPGEDFNYNKFLNIGLRECKNEWILISNNDTCYHKNWLTQMMIQHRKTGLLSMSAYCPGYRPHAVLLNKDQELFYGYSTGLQLTGWCILLNKKVIEIIGEFDERFYFWFQDDDYAENLKLHKIEHALVKKAIVTHFLSKSHGLVSKEKRRAMTTGLAKVFKEKWPNARR